MAPPRRREAACPFTRPPACPAPLARPGRRRASIGLALLLALGACGRTDEGSAVRRAPPPARPSLLLVTIDTWRWDHVGASGEGKVATPTLDRLAGEGVYEREAVTPCPLTTPAHATLLTGLNPLSHGVLDCASYALPPGIPTLAESFRGNGYSTAAFVSGETLRSRYGLNRGFEVYDDTGMDNRGLADWQPASREGARVVDAALAHLAGRPGDPPIFLWVHLFDPHLPYRGHEPFAGRYPGRPYAAEVAYADAQVGRLVAGLPKGGGGWRIVIVGDHGEGLGDHGEREHGYGLYRSTLHVPLIIHPAPERPLLHPRPWGLVDLSPTLREWFGLARGGESDGESLFDGGPSTRALATITLLPSITFGVQPILGARRESFNYLRHEKEELYDLSRDPGETDDLSRDPLHRSALRLLRQAAPEIDSSSIQEALDRAYRRPSDEALRSLASLGYLSGGGGIQIAGRPVADLHELMREREELDRQREAAFTTGKRGALRERFAALCRAYPRSTFFLKNYASLSLQEGDFQAAADACRNAIRLDPMDAESMTNGGTASIMLGRFEEARTLLEGALKLNEADPLAHKNLAILYGRDLGRPADALIHLERYLQLQPGAPDRQAMEAWAEQLRAAGR